MLDSAGPVGPGDRVNIFVLSNNWKRVMLATHAQCLSIIGVKSMCFPPLRKYVPLNREYGRHKFVVTACILHGMLQVSLLRKWVWTEFHLVNESQNIILVATNKDTISFEDSYWDSMRLVGFGSNPNQTVLFTL